ncbi:hypothetical protein ABZ864_33335 [Streptomyces sp. NPDC047082]|uniref:hypothetical protein n=1 Tax=Streptomyces sp. NPDC047082 TaxID=3155259 RepID=UPI0033F70960
MVVAVGASGAGAVDVASGVEQAAADAEAVGMTAAAAAQFDLAAGLPEADAGALPAPGERLDRT